MVHYQEQGLTATSHAKTAEPIEMQQGMMSQTGPGNHVFSWVVDGPTGTCTFGMSG